jgi:hypothetical protein
MEDYQRAKHRTQVLLGFGHRHRLRKAPERDVEELLYPLGS